MFHLNGLKNSRVLRMWREARFRSFGVPVGLAAALAIGNLVPEFEPESDAAIVALTSPDSDLDGLSDTLESYLNVVSSKVAWDASPSNPDTDGDGQPDGFEYCLSGRNAVVSPANVLPVLPKVTIGTHQVGSEVIVSIFVIPGSISAVDNFKMFIGARAPGSAAKVSDITPLLGTSLTSIGFSYYGPYSMAIIEMRIPVDTIRYYGSIALGAGGRVGLTKMTDNATLSWHNGKIYRWSYLKLQGAGSGSGNAAGNAEPQDSTNVTGSQAEVCGSIDLQLPTGVPGLLESVVQSIGCATGTFVCEGGICSDTGAAAAPKLILDIDLLLGF